MDKDTLFYKKHTICCRGKIVDISQPIVMGILNVTPDSFFDGGKYSSPLKIKQRAGKILEEGAKIIDLGAYSSRPNAENISEKEEISRLENALDIIRSEYPDAIISIDTFRAKAAQLAIEKFNADIINDISGGSIEPEIIDIVACYQTPYITMHMQGSPETMQNAPSYKHIVKDLIEFFSEHISVLHQKGINDIIIDPGFGFGKTIEHNYQLMGGLDVFQILELPVLIGISRKSMIYKYLNTTPDNSLTGTIVLNTLALQKGASILRVHDVKEAMETISIYNKFTEESEKSINLLKEV